MKNRTCDILIVGGGIMGSSTAYNLIKLDPNLKVVVVERDFSYEKSSTTLSVANIRSVGFNLKENVLLSVETLKVLKTFEEEMAVDGERPAIQFRPEGNLMLADSAGLDAAKTNFEMAKSAGANPSWFEPDDLEKRWPMLNLEGISGGTFGADDGHLDVYSLLMAFKKKGKKLGVEYIEDEVTEITGTATEVTGAKLISGEQITSGITINCAGAWASDLLKPLGIHLPVDPTRRQVFAVDCKVKYDDPIPFIFHPSGLWLRSEGDLIVAAKAMDDDLVGFDWEWEKERFMEVIWPGLMDVIPDFGELRLIRGWAGLYEENTFDHNAIIGTCPGTKSLYLCNGFSGHGVMQGLPAGQNIAEIITGKTPTMDLSIFSAQRIFDDCPVGECGRF